MKCSHLKALSIGIMLALICGPLAMAKQTHDRGGNSHDAAKRNYIAMRHDNIRIPQADYHAAPRPASSPTHYRLKGERYDESRQVVGNWGYYRLGPPPFGHEWVQNGHQFALIQTTSGIITQTVVNSMPP